MNKLVLIIIVILVAIIGGYFLLRGGYQYPTTPTSTPTTTEVGAPEGQGTSTVEAKEIIVVGTEFAFSPSVITVQAGEKVKLIFRNEGGTLHNLVIEGLGINTKTIGKDQTNTIEFIAPSFGTYVFFCSVPGHRASGMEGNFRVE